MVLGGRSVLAIALDARQPSLWTSVIDRVQCVLVWSRPLCSGSSPRTSGMLVWWVPWQVVWAGPGHVGRCTKDIGVVGSASASLRRVCRRRKDCFFLVFFAFLYIVIYYLRKVVKERPVYIYPRAMQSAAMAVAVAGGLPLVPPKSS